MLVSLQSLVFDPIFISKSFLSCFFRKMRGKYWFDFYIWFLSKLLSLTLPLICYRSLWWITIHRIILLCSDFQDNALNTLKLKLQYTDLLKKKDSHHFWGGFSSSCVRKETKIFKMPFLFCFAGHYPLTFLPHCKYTSYTDLTRICRIVFKLQQQESWFTINVQLSTTCINL